MSLNFGWSGTNLLINKIDVNPVGEMMSCNIGSVTDRLESRSDISLNDRSKEGVRYMI